MVVITCGYDLINVLNVISFYYLCEIKGATAKGNKLFGLKIKTSGEPINMSLRQITLEKLIRN